MPEPVAHDMDGHTLQTGSRAGAQIVQPDQWELASRPGGDSGSYGSLRLPAFFGLVVRLDQLMHQPLTVPDGSHAPTVTQTSRSVCRSEGFASALVSERDSP